MKIPIRFTLNGRPATAEVLIDGGALCVLRDHFKRTGVKEGCGVGECGACTIVVDGKAVNACLMPGPALDGKTVWTVEGLSAGGGLHPLQQSFIQRHAVQCGYCTPGMLMSAWALLQENPAPTPGEVTEAISGNLCRCTGYVQIVSAVLDAARKTSGENGDT